MGKRFFEQGKPNNKYVIERELSDHGISDPREWKKALDLETPLSGEDVSQEVIGGADRLAEAVEKLGSRDVDRVDIETTYYPQVGLLADGDSIVDQQVDVIQSPTETYVRFKFTKKRPSKFLIG